MPGAVEHRNRHRNALAHAFAHGAKLLELHQHAVEPLHALRGSAHANIDRDGQHTQATGFVAADFARGGGGQPLGVELEFAQGEIQAGAHAVAHGSEQQVRGRRPRALAQRRRLVGQNGGAIVGKVQVELVGVDLLEGDAGGLFVVHESS